MDANRLSYASKRVVDQVIREVTDAGESGLRVEQIQEMVGKLFEGDKSKLSRASQKYISLTQKLTWCGLPLKDAAAEMRHWARRHVHGDHNFKTVLFQTADIRERVLLSLFQSQNADDKELIKIKEGKRRLRCSVVPMVGTNIGCLWNESNITFHHLAEHGE